MNICLLNILLPKKDYCVIEVIKTKQGYEQLFHIPICQVYHINDVYYRDLNNKAEFFCLQAFPFIPIISEN